jgi:hypothetical protein
MAVPPQEVCQADLGFPAIAVGMDLHLLIFDDVPKPFDQDVVVAVLPSWLADLDLLGLQPRHEVS